VSTGKAWSEACGARLFTGGRGAGGNLRRPDGFRPDRRAAGWIQLSRRLNDTVRATIALEQAPKKLIDFFDKSLLQRFDFERFLIVRKIPFERKAR
jgi:hypothetical protein